MNTAVVVAERDLRPGEMEQRRLVQEGQRAPVKLEVEIRLVRVAEEGEMTVGYHANVAA